MADLSPFGTSRGGDRGQIILITAFILALAFVVLALIVNSAIFTENLATRDDVAGSQDTIQHRYEVERSVGNVIETVNNDSSLDNVDAEESIADISAQNGLQQAPQGRLVNVSFVSDDGGKRIAQDNATRNFTSNTSEADWRVARDVTDSRNFVINVTNPGDANLDFTLRINDTTPSVDEDWILNIQNAGTDDVLLTVETPLPTDKVASCLREDVGSYVTIDVTDGMFDGEPCHALTRHIDDGTPMWYGVDVGSPYFIDFENADTITGTYSLIVDNSAALNGTLYGSDVDRFPYFEDSGIVYSITVNYAYYTQAVGYETEFTVAPGEAPP